MFKKIFFLLLLTVGISPIAFSSLHIVKSTDDSGLATLRDLINIASDNDTILIDVKGEIVLLSPIVMNSVNNLTIIGPYPKHITIKEASSTGNAIFELIGCSNVSFKGIAFKDFTGIRTFSLLNSTNILIEDCLFENNTVNTNGNFLINNTSTTIKKSSFIGNSAEQGGAIFISSTPNTLFENCTFYGNVATVESGGAIKFTNNSLVNFNHCSFKENFCSSASINYGHAIHGDNTSPSSNQMNFRNTYIGYNGPLGELQVSSNFTPLGYFSNQGNVIILNGGADSNTQYITNMNFTIINDKILPPSTPDGLRTNLVEDGYGLKYLPIVLQSSPLTDAGKIYAIMPQKDTRRAPRILTGDVNFLPDAGACEYTKYRVINKLSSGGGSISNVVSSLSSTTDPLKYIEFDFQPLYDPTIPIEITASLNISEPVYIDGYSQNSTSISGPDIMAGIGVTPAENLIQITPQSTTDACFVVSDTNITLTGFSIHGFSSRGIFTNTNGFNCKIFGNHIGFYENMPGSYLINENQSAGIYVSGKKNQIGGNSHWQRNVVSGNGLTGTIGGNYHNIFVVNSADSCKIIGNFIGCHPNGNSEFTYSSTNTPSGISIKSTTCEVGNEKYLGANIIGGNKAEGVLIDNPSGINYINNNKIGIGFNGETAIPNVFSGIKVVNNTFGVDIGNKKGNIISGNALIGILIISSSNVQINNNIIGLNENSNNIVANTEGVRIFGTSNNNRIGNDITDGNIISGNNLGIVIESRNNNIIRGNKIGVDVTSEINFGNTNEGIILMTTDATIVGGDISQRNIISGNLNGISLINSGTGTIIKGNYIGLNMDGTTSIPNTSGIIILDSHEAAIGGDFTVFENNVISGNSGDGIIFNNNLSILSGNTIGLAVDNSTPISNNNGIRINSDNVSIGDATYPNIIAGNSNNGVYFDDVDNGSLNNCYIGTNTTFDTGIGNGVSGIFITGGTSNQIGNILDVFIGNNINGIHIENSTSNVIRRSLIGIGSGNQLIPNENGILLNNGANLNSINNALITKNVISGNLENGILIEGVGTNSNNISSNYIGTNINGDAAIPNNKGIYIKDNANENTIGASGDLARRNTISGNTEEGILIQNAETNRIFRNYIGSDATNSTAIPNQTGVKVENCTNENFVGNLVSTINKPIISGNHTGVLISNSSNQKVWNCIIGAISSGASDLGNVHGLVLLNSNNNSIGGINAFESNLISANDSIGISILNSHNNTIKGNKIGTTITGNAALSNLIGVYISNSNGNIFGENTALGHNTISANSIAGVIMENNCQDNEFISNFFGTSETGNSVFFASENPIGIYINNVPTENLIGGVVDNGNVFVNSSINIYIENSSNQIVEGNKIGFSFDGLNYLGTPSLGDGILLKNATNNHIGNTTAGRENSIANQNNGIYLVFSDDNFIEKNYIGNNTDGTAVLVTGNQNTGIKIDSTSSNNIVRNENIISGNQNQLMITGVNTSNNHIHNNIIGLDITGENVLNSSNGIVINNFASENIIGGLTSERNIISGQINGVLILNNGTNNNIISGNYFGSNATGNAPLPNTISIKISQGTGNIIGGNISDSTNFIGGGDAGIQFFPSANNNFVRGNHIGFKPDLSSHTSGAGIEIIDSEGNFIGGIDSEKINRIENNQFGIAISGTSTSNSMIGNIMKNNSIIGIDINVDGPTFDNVTGIQGNIQIPTILQAFQCNGTGNTKVAVEIRNLIPSQQYLIEFFNNTTFPSVTGYGEASDFIDRFSHTAIQTTDTVIIDLGVLLPVSNSISATLTSQNGNGNTSEFAQNFSISNQPTTPLFSTQNETCENANDASLTIDNTANPSSAYYFSYNATPYIYSNTDVITFTLPTGSYIPNVKYLNGCEVSGSVSVLAPGPSISYNITTVDDTCGLSTGEITINNTSSISDFPNAFEYAFDAVNYTSIFNQSNLTAGTSYIIVLKTNIGLVECFSDTTTLTVQAYNMTNGELEFEYNDFCYSSNGQVTVMPVFNGGTYSLSPILGAESINGSTGEITNAIQDQTYLVEYEYGTCSYSQSPTAINEQDASFDFNDHCFGQIEIPTAIISGGTYTFNPIPTDGASINGSTGEISNPIPGTTYQVEYNTGGGCAGTLIQPVLVFPLSNAPEIISFQNLYCGEEIVQSLSTNIGSDANWYLGTTTSGIVETNSFFTPSLNFGNNTILATYFDSNLCESLPGEIVIFKSDISLMSAGDDVEICLGAEAQLNAIGGETYEWINITGENDIYNPIVQPLFPTNYIVIITNQDGCSVQDSVLVSFINGNLCDIETFNAFSPNEDGVNDFWHITGIEGYPENKVTIFNRWGDIVNSFDNYDNQNIIWNGQNKNAIFVPSGTYYFVIDVNGNQSQSGWVQVLR